MKVFGYEVYLLVMNMSKYYFLKEKLLKVFNYYVSIYDVKVDNWVKFLQVLWYFWGIVFYYIVCFCFFDFEKKLVKLFW